MLNVRRHTHQRQRGFTLLEVLITIIILAFGLLGLANLQAKVHLTEMESYQRAQAVLLLQDMVDRMNINRSESESYVTGLNSPLGVGDGQPLECGALPTGTPAQLVVRDRCEWSNALKGAAERIGTGVDAQRVGAMINARGCVERIQAPNPAPGVCDAGIYRITVVWQGLHSTVDPALLCAAQIDDYGAEGFRRAISKQLTIGLPGCTSP
jgi:type IV pilus assembly protein PilV